MNYINLNKKRLVGRNNQSLNSFLALDYHISDTIEFQLINDKNQIQDIPSGYYYFAGAIIKPNNESELLFVSNDFTIRDNTLIFHYNTYTQSFLEQIKRKNTQINIEIGYKDGTLQYLVLRDYALVNPRAYISGLPPQPVVDYYTKSETDSLFELKSEAFDGSYNSLTDKPTIPTKTSQLQNDSGFITGYTQIDPVFEANSGLFELKSEAFDGSYNSLTDKPTIPTKTSQLQNDSGFITGYVESDPVFEANSGLFELKSEAFDGSYNSLTDKPTIPTKTSQLQNDSGFITGYIESDPIFEANSGLFELKSEAFDGDYNSLTNKPTIPTKTSQLQNDSGFITGYVESDPVFASLSGEFAKDLDYVEFNNNALTVGSNKFYKSSIALSSFNINIPSGITNTIVFFTTGSTFNYTVTCDNSLFVNQAFDFQSNSSYVIAVENNCVVWSFMRSTI